MPYPFNAPFPYPHYVQLHTLCVCRKFLFHIINIDMPASVAALPLNAQLVNLMNTTTVQCKCMTCFLCGQDKGEYTYSKNKDSTVLCTGCFNEGPINTLLHVYFSLVSSYSEAIPSVTLITQKRKQLAQQKSNQLQKKIPTMLCHSYSLHNYRENN